MPVLEVEVDLSSGQMNKFKKLFALMELVNGKAYFPESEMHGVLLTQSRQTAINKIRANLPIVQQYLLDIDGKPGIYIKHIGIDVLLEHLAECNPKKAAQYLAVRGYISSYLANSAEVIKDAMINATQLEKSKISAMEWVRKSARVCSLSGTPFGKGVECDVHHIEGVSERPDLQDVASNLIALSSLVHMDYHRWAIQNQQEVSRITLKQFAMLRGYRTDW